MSKTKKMIDFIYQDPYPILKDDTQYRKITSDFVKVEKFGEREILTVDPKGLELLAEEALTDVSFMLRTTHLQKLRKILDDPEATDNDRFVAYNLLQNASVVMKDNYQVTGYRNCNRNGKKGESIFTGVDDAEWLSKGIFNTYQKRNLRYSQIVPISMFEEKIQDQTFPRKLIFMLKKELLTSFYLWQKVADLQTKPIYINKQNHY